MKDDVGSESTLEDDWVRTSASPTCVNRGADTPVFVSMADLETDVGQLELSPASSVPSFLAVTAELTVDRYCHKWLGYLGAQNKPFFSREFVTPYSGVDAHLLLRACEELSSSHKTVTADDLKTVLWLYCDREGCSFNPDWIKLLDMLIPLNCNIDQLYNLFYAINTKFLPRNALKGAICYQLMYLVLQYHDPRLSSHLNSYKITAYEYARSCFTSIFAGDFEKEAVYMIWDKYFHKGDPFMLFSMTLVFMINLADEILALEDRQQILDLISGAASKFSAKDVVDFFNISDHFLQQTPPSIKKDYQRALFGSQNEGDLRIDVSGLLALPVDPRDLLGLTSDENKNIDLDFKFFIIDARPHDQYAAGHIDASYNLDSTLFVQAPEQYQIALSSLDSYRMASHPDDHLLFIGSGHSEEDSYVYMMVANFLHNARKNIALVEGGYEALHKLIAPDFEKLDGHYESLCKECNSRFSGPICPARKLSWKSKMEKLISTVKTSAPTVSEKMWRIAQFPAAAVKKSSQDHVDTSQRHGKKYRNERSVFTLSDSDSDVETLSNSVLVEKTDEPKALGDILAQDDILDHFEGMELLSNGSSWRTVNCVLALTRTYIHVFHEEGKDGKVVPRSRHAYGTVLRVTSKKKIPEMLTFKFGYGLGENEYKITAVQRFVLPKAGDCAKAIKMNIVNLHPGILN